MNKLTKKESQESMMVTWGRIHTAAYQKNSKRLQALVEKFNKDIQVAKIDEGYFSRADPLYETPRERDVEQYTVTHDPAIDKPNQNIIEKESWD